MSLEPGHNIDVPPKHGLRRGGDEIVVYMAYNAESSTDRSDILSDDFVEGIFDNVDDFDRCASAQSCRRVKIFVSNFQW